MTRHRVRELALAIASICMLAGWAPTALASTPLTPSVTATPALTGTPKAGETLSCSTGSWTNDPSGFTYAWLRDGVPIVGQSGSAYVVQGADEGHAIACEVTASVLGDEYEITGLPSESYRVSFSAAREAGYLSQYFSGQSSVTEATPVAVTAPNATPGINASLAVGGKLSGRVTDESLAPLAEVEVCIGFLNCRHTNANGEYTFSGLPAGSYTVSFNPEALGQVCSGAVCEEYEAQFYDEKSGSEAPDRVTVTPPSTTAGIDAVLRSRSIPVGSIAGTVSGTAGALAGVQACARVFESFPWHCATTNASGQYTIEDLPEGEEYVVGFFPKEGQNYVARYSEETLEEPKATKISVTAGETTKVDETLEEGGKISGVVTGKSQGLAGIEVCPDDYLLLNVLCTKTDAEGKYTLVGLPASSTYEVYFAHNQDTAYLPTVKTKVYVAVGSTSTLNADLVEGGSISGSVTTAGGAAFAGGKVCTSSPGEGTRCASTDPNGEYTIVGLPQGSYKVVFSGEQCSAEVCAQDYLGETYSPQVPVEVAQATPGIDAELVEGGKITGAITLAGGGALVGGIEACTSPTAENKAYEARELRKCAKAHEAVGSASATSNALTIATSRPKVEPKGRHASIFKLVKKRFDARTGKLDLFFEVFYAGSLKWKLTFTSPGGKGKRTHRRASGPFGKGSRNVSPGPVEIKVKASAKAAKALRSGRLLRIKGEVSLKLASGGVEATKLNVPAHQAKHAKHRHKRKHRHRHRRVR